MAIKKKILLGYGVVFAMTGLVLIWAISHLVLLGKASDAILSENYRSILAAENMVDAIERQDSAVLLMLLGDRKVGKEQFREFEAIFIEWLARAEDNLTIQGEAELTKTIKSDYASFRQLFSQLTEHLASEKQSLGSEYYSQNIFPAFFKVREQCIRLRNLNEGVMYEASVSAGIMAKRAIWSTSLVGGTALFIALLFSILLAEKIVSPVKSFMKASRKISAGDYSVQIPVETGDELGQLALEFNQMAAQLHRYHEINIDQLISEKSKGEAILNSIEDGLIVLDTSLKITGINPSARRILGLEFSEATGMECSEFLPNANLSDLIKKGIETGFKNQIPDEQRIITLETDSQQRHYLLSVTAVKNKAGSLFAVILLLRDITRLKEIEKLKSDFVMAASHELRTPLTSLGMSIDLLMENASIALAPRDKDLLATAHEEVHRMKALISDLLDLSKIEAGKIELEIENVPVATLFEHANKVFKSQLMMKEVELKFEISENLPVVRADANKITWVLTNLVSNALRYAEKGGHIIMMAHRIGGQVHISVKDDGPGIAPEYQSKIFLKFVQIKGRESGGTGLGLAICKEIVRAHGGAIWVESGPEKGSIFTFTLPTAIEENIYGTENNPDS